MMLILGFALGMGAGLFIAAFASIDREQAIRDEERGIAREKRARARTREALLRADNYELWKANCWLRMHRERQKMLND